MTPFTVTVDRHATNSCVITVVGELDALAAPILRRTLGAEIAHGYVHLVLEASRLHFCDSQGLWVLIQAMRQTAAEGGSFRLAAPTPSLRRLLTLTRVADGIPIHEDVPAALDPPGS